MKGVTLAKITLLCSPYPNMPHTPLFATSGWGRSSLKSLESSGNQEVKCKSAWCKQTPGPSRSAGLRPFCSRPKPTFQSHCRPGSAQEESTGNVGEACRMPGPCPTSPPFHQIDSRPLKGGLNLSPCFGGEDPEAQRGPSELCLGMLSR